MKKTFKKTVPIVLALALLLCGCGRSDIKLTVNKDGSFDVDVNYGITKALVANDEAMTQVKTLITDSLDENSIPYTESEDDELYRITVQRSFKDIDELTSPESWTGLGFVPTFSTSETGGDLWVRYDKGQLKLDGVLNIEAFKASDLISSDNAAIYEGSLTVVLPDDAESSNAGSRDANTYTWSGSGEDSVNVSLVSSRIMDKSYTTVTDDNSDDAAPMDVKPMDEDSKDSGSAGKIIIPIIAVIAIGTAVFVIVRNMKKTPNSKENAKADAKEDAKAENTKEDTKVENK